jgi:hypothetical protein
VSYALNNVTTADGYTAPTTLAAPGSRRLLLHVRNAAIYYQVGNGTPASVWQTEVFMPPGTAGLLRTFDALRVRSATPGKPAQVTAEASGVG